MRILLWHVHGSWTTAFVQGPHEYLVPVLPDRGPDGRGRAQTWDWPGSVREVAPEALVVEEFDLVVLQRPHEVDLVAAWTGRRPGIDVAAVYVEHNTPVPHPTDTRHPVADRDDIHLVHVTHFNRMNWDNGAAPATVIEHGICDPGQQWTGDIDRLAIAINEPIRRDRVVGADLLPLFAQTAGLDVFGMSVTGVGARYGIPADRCREFEDLPQGAMHRELARRRVYVHTARWTSLGLSLLEAMHLGMPVVVLAATEAPRAVPAEAGCVSSDLTELIDAVGHLHSDPIAAAHAGDVARAFALKHYGVNRFLHDWEDLIEEVVA